MSAVREYILTSAEFLFESSALKLDEHSENLLIDFIHNSQNLILQASVSNENKLIFSNLQSNKNKSIIFFKTIPGDLTSKNALSYINMVTLSTSAAESLYQVLRQIYSPLLASGDDLYSNKLQKNLSDLEANLRVLTYNAGDKNVNFILCIKDEAEYWSTVGQKRDASKKDRDAASAFCVLFEDMSEEIRSFQSSSLQDVRDSLENIAGILDDVWRYAGVPYPQDRMVHVFDIVGHVACSVIQQAVDADQLWKVHNGVKDNEVLTNLSYALNAMKTWISACKSLTDMYWPNYALHSWKGNCYIPSFCVNFEARLNEIHNIRSTFNQLSKLLTVTERSELRTDQLFEPFQNVNIWIINGLNQSWENAVAKFSSNLRPAESKIAEKLKPRMHNTSSKQMLYEFMRYKTLIIRPIVKSALSDELELFVSSLISMLKVIQIQLDSDDIDVEMFQPAEMSPIVHQVQWAKQMEAKVKEIKSCAENYLIEFENSSELLALASKVLADLKTTYTQLHEEWSRELQGQVKSGSLRLAAEAPVLQFSRSSRLLAVGVPARLERWRAEARALAALGLPAPAPAQRALDALASVIPHARALHQVASFHNTLGERMIPSTRPMMLQAALDLSALVQDHKPVYWNDEEQLISYTEKLKNMVLKLETQNTYLTGQHIAIRNIVEQLMDTELLAKQSQWKKNIKEIRNIIEKVEANGYKNTEIWRSHWDVQLYKAIECQYIKTLLSLHTHFPPVKVDLVLRGHMVRVQPPLEQLRAQHYSQLRRLVSLPAQFVPLRNNITENESIFATIVEKHSWVGNKAVWRVEAALRSLEAARARWARRAAPACADLAGLCAAHLTAPHHWEDNFKACKAYGQAVAKMTFDDEKIFWITVGTVSLRREFETQARNLWSTLMSSLQTSCRSDTETLQTFMASAMLMIENNTLPKNAKELTEISAQQQALQANLPMIEKLVEDLKRKSHMLRTWGGDPTIDNAVKEWQKIREQILSQQELFEHQAEVVKSGLRGEWENLSSSAEAWAGRWAQARARLTTTGVSYAELVGRAGEALAAVEQYERLVADKDELLIECQKFNLKLDVSDTWTEADKLRTEFIELWSILRDYNEEYEMLASQEWIVIQKKLHQLDDFITQWSSRLEPYTTVTLFIKGELDKYSDLTTALKYLRGTDFIEIHWREIFVLLEMEYRKPDTLQLKHFLEVASKIKKQMKAIQKISSSASSEAAIRNTLNEIELWFAGARFTIIYYSDASKRSVPIVKDYKDVFAKVEEQQWAASAGGPAAEAWAARLRTAARVTRAAHHTQRRSVSTFLTGATAAGTVVQHRVP